MVKLLMRAIVPALGVIVFFSMMMLGPVALHAEGLKVTKGWVRFAPPGVKVHGGYMQLHNHAKKARTLVGATSSAYDRVELHTSLVKDGIASMEKLKSITIGAGEMVSFEPGGKHLMLFGPVAAQKLGATVPLTLNFKDGQKVTVEAKVAKGAGKAGAKDQSRHGDHTHH